MRKEETRNQKEWNSLPPELKRHVMLNLDNFDRLRIRQCSSTTRNISNTIPIITHFVNFVSTVDNRFSWLVWVDEEGQNCVNNKNECMKEGGGTLAVKTLLNFFTNRFSLVKYLDFSNVFNTENGASTVEELVAKARTRIIKIRTEELLLELNETDSVPMVKEFFELFDGSALKTLILIDSTSDIVSAISGMDLWRNCTEIRLCRQENRYPAALRYSLTSFMHLDKLNIYRDNYTALEIYDFVKNYKIKSLKLGDNFLLHSQNPIPEEQIISLLDTLPGQSDHDSDDEDYVFYIENPEIQLEVGIYETCIIGSVVKRQANN